MSGLLSDEERRELADSFESRKEAYEKELQKDLAVLQTILQREPIPPMSPSPRPPKTG